MDIQALEILSNLAAITTKQGSGDAEVVSGDFSRLLNEINTMQSVSDMQEEICKKFNVTLHVVDYACNTTDQTAENFDLAMLDSGKFYGAGDTTKREDVYVKLLKFREKACCGRVIRKWNNKGELQTYYIGIRWKEGGIPEIQGTSVSNVAEIKLTEKGYFIYAYEYVIAHASLRQYWRIEPLPEDCQELTEKYISGLSYVNYNVLVTNWDSSNVEDILMPCMYEDIYRISTGENLKTEDWKIPAEEYERIMTTYFPVSVEQLREHCGYAEGSNSYEYEMIYASPYPPFGEVVDYTKNADGTITLIVDGVWPDYNSDLAFRNTVVVLPFEDGTFRYLSNSIEQIELELPPIARKKG